MPKRIKGVGIHGERHRRTWFGARASLATDSEED
jgi:hypothetical protein